MNRLTVFLAVLAGLTVVASVAIVVTVLST